VARNLVNIEEVSKAFDIRALLERVSLGVSEGDRIGIVGRNGSGKSTLMKIIAAIEQPDQGRVTKANSVKIGLLSQVDKADPNSTVGDVVIGDRAKHEWASDSEIREVFTGLFGGFDDHLFERKFATLSGGEKRRVGLAKLLIDDLDLILLDEPTSGLDLPGREDLLTRFATFASDPSSPASIIVTHHLEEIPVGTTHALLIKNGQIAYAGEIDEVLTTQNVSEVFNYPLTVTKEGARFFARANR